MKKAPHTYQENGAYGEQLSFLPTPLFSAISPEIGTLQHRALRAMMQKPITQIDWLSSGNGWRLSAAINSLKNKGWNIKSERYIANDKQIAIYSLSPESLAFLQKLLNQEDL